MFAVVFQEINFIEQKMAHFDCRYEGQVCILSPKEEMGDQGQAMIAHIRSVVEWLVAQEEKIGVITPLHHEFRTDSSTSQIKLERMIPLSEELSELLDEKIFLDFLEQATEIARKLSMAKVHHNDLKPSNFVYTVHEGKRKYFVIDFGQSQVFNDEWKPTNKDLLDKDFCRDFGYEEAFDPEYNYRDFFHKLGEFTTSPVQWRKIKIMAQRFQGLAF